MKKIKVLHTITKIGVGGASENTLLSAKLLNPEIYDVSVLCGAKCDDKMDVEEFLGQKIDIHYSNTLVREISPIKDILHLFEMIRYLRKNGVDIIHTHSSKAGILHRIAAKIAGVAYIVHSIHGWSFNDRMSSKVKSLYVSLERFVEKFTDKLIAVTEFDIIKGLDEKISTKEKYVKIHSSIEIDKYTAISKSNPELRNEFGIKENEIIVGTVSRMDTQKAPQDFVSVAKAVCDKFDKVKFIFVGDGPLRNEVEHKIESLGLKDKIILTGIRTDVNNFMNLFDIFILTSLWEGLPRVFSQAMAAKLPIVATNVNGAPEAIIDGKNGFLLEPKDISGLSDRITHLIENQDKRLEYGKYGFENILPDFDINDMIQKIDDLYQSLLIKKDTK